MVFSFSPLPEQGINNFYPVPKIAFETKMPFLHFRENAKFPIFSEISFPRIVQAFSFSQNLSPKAPASASILSG
jgi:hypothetical protein